MALEDLTGTGKFIGALNPAWPVDDDWVDEGDNHIRGIKNVLKNTFPDTNVAVSWSGTQARFPDGTLAAPGIAWVNEPATGLRRVGPADTRVTVGGVDKFAWGGPNNISLIPFWVNGGYSGGLADANQAPLRVDAPSGQAPGLVFYRTGVSYFRLAVDFTGTLMVGSSVASGPGPLNNDAMRIGADGNVYARSFNVTAGLLRSNERALDGALEKVLALKGTRYFDEEMKREAIGVAVDEVAAAFPELLGEVGGARVVDCTGLAGPLIEAVRELAQRVVQLEAKLAGR